MRRKGKSTQGNKKCVYVKIQAQIACVFFTLLDEHCTTVGDRKVKCNYYNLPHLPVLADRVNNKKSSKPQEVYIVFVRRL